jgi:catechol 2,3-dioxygenase-like lactoylglutathione lyase family enzyme
MPADGKAHVRIARPSRDLEAARRFWVDGLGLEELFRRTSNGTGTVTGERGGTDHSLLMVGWRDASWHLELVQDPNAPLDPRPTVEDLLVIYLNEPVPDTLIDRLVRHGGTTVPAHNPYWDRWGVTLEDPDGYRLVLSVRDWSNA